jgi:hypothetical protein
MAFNIPGPVFIIVGVGAILMSVFIDVEKLAFFILVGAVFVVAGFLKIISKEKKNAVKQPQHAAAHHAPGKTVQHAATHTTHPHNTHHNIHPNTNQHIQHEGQHNIQHKQTLRCAGCGVKLHSLFKYCPNCGHKLK